MKRIIILLAALFLAFNIQAQSPTKFNYQAVARDASGAVLANQNVSFLISVLQGSASGTSVYTETHATTSNGFGLVNLSIGGGTVSSGDMNTINWANGPYFIKVEIDPLGGTNYTLVSTQELLSVPYALYANNTPSDTLKADKVVGAVGGNIATLNANGNLVDGGKSTTDFLDKTNTVAYTPSDTYHPATKQYVDDAINNQTLYYYLPVTFGTAYTSNTTTLANIPLYTLLPNLPPGKTSCTISYSIVYKTSNLSTSGEVGLVDYTNYVGGVPTLVSGSSLSLTSSTLLSNVSSVGTVTITSGHQVCLAFRKTIGAGTLTIEGIVYTVRFN